MKIKASDIFLPKRDQRTYEELTRPPSLWPVVLFAIAFVVVGVLVGYLLDLAPVPNTEPTTATAQKEAA